MLLVKNEHNTQNNITHINEMSVIIIKQLKGDLKHNFSNKSKMCLKSIWFSFVKISKFSD